MRTTLFSLRALRGALRKRLLGGTPVAALDRTAKAQMIEAIVCSHRKRGLSDLDLLDIGCGNGGISRYFARCNRVTGVDVVDRRPVAGSSAAPESPGSAFAFVLLDSESLPFSDGSFDVVLSHHVIEHVNDQRRHLREIHRVLQPNGICYMATPNRSSPIMQGHVGNPQVLHHAAMAPLFESCGFGVTEYSLDVLTRPDQYRYPLRLGRWLPTALAAPLRRYYPSHMFVLDKPQP